MITALKSRQDYFLADRNSYLGASDMAAILGVDDHKTALDVYNEKLGLVPRFEGNNQTKRGQRLEDIAAQEYSQHTGNKVHRRRTELLHPQYDFIRGHIDRRVVGDKRPVEIKVPSRGMFHKMKREGLPMSQIVQMQSYLWLDASPVGDFAIFCPDVWELLPFEVPAQPELFEKIERYAVVFWQEHVLRQVPPIPTKQDAPAIEFAKIVGEVIHRDDPEFTEAALLFREAKQLEKDSELLIDLAKKRVKEVVDSKFGKYQGGGMRLAYFQSQGRTSFDKKALAAAYPQIDLSQFEKRGDPFEVLKPIFAIED
jgi:putative phage-type endonuclease